MRAAFADPGGRGPAFDDLLRVRQEAAAAAAGRPTAAAVMAGFAGDVPAGLGAQAPEDVVSGRFTVPQCFK
jgi:hypothetical protein